MEHYLFYDIETTGTNACFDQIVQFAGIKTDLDLNEVDRIEINFQLMKDVVPSPYASITHQLPLINEGKNDYEAMAMIHDWVNEPGTWSGGYNTLKFDDEFLRFGFFRNFFDPYTHQFANGCGRFDLFPMMNLYYLFHEDLLEWPRKNGKLSLKLDALSQANHLAKGQAHHAMVDVEATVALAKKLKEKEETFNWLMKGFDKNQDSLNIERFDVASSQDHHQRLALWVDHRFGEEKSFMVPVLVLGRHYRYRNQLVLLRLDNAEVLGQEISSIQTHISKRKFGEPCYLLPWVDRYLQKLPKEYAESLKGVPDNISKHSQWLHDVAEWYREQNYDAIDQVDVVASLYQMGFWSVQEKLWCEDWHAAPPKAKAKLLNDVSNQHMKALGGRFLWRHYPDVLTQSQKNEMDDYWLSLIGSESLPSDYLGRERLLPATALNQISDLESKSLTLPQQKALADLKSYLVFHFKSKGL